MEGQRGKVAKASASLQRSFRLSERTMKLLDARARELSESRNSLAERLLDEGLHTERHPLIVFRTGGSGRRRPALVGTRLYVWQIIETLRGSDNSVREAVAYLSLPEHHVQAAVDYYADFKDEVDEDRADELAFERRERYAGSARSKCSVEAPAGRALRHQNRRRVARRWP
jgi:uncharacterized protein (DUF433 family)